MGATGRIVRFGGAVAAGGCAGKKDGVQGRGVVGLSGAARLHARTRRSGGVRGGGVRSACVCPEGLRGSRLCAGRGTRAPHLLLPPLLSLLLQSMVLLSLVLLSMVLLSLLLLPLLSLLLLSLLLLLTLLLLPLLLPVRLLLHQLLVMLALLLQLPLLRAHECLEPHH